MSNLLCAKHNTTINICLKIGALPSALLMSDLRLLTTIPFAAHPASNNIKESRFSRAMLVRILSAVCPGAALVSSVDRPGGNKCSKRIVGSAPSSNSRPSTISNVELDLLLRELKNGLVGNELAKSEALRLGIVAELLNVLDASPEQSLSGTGTVCSAVGATTIAVGGGGSSNRSDDHDCVINLALHVFGLLVILISSPGCDLSASGGRIVEHIARTLACGAGEDGGSERLRMTALRCLSAICKSVAHRTQPDLAPLSRLWGTVALSKIAHRILEDIAGRAWSPALRTLGVDALAAITRDRDLAEMMGASIASTGTLLLRPVLPAR